jgi:hypothetical protein
MGCMYKVQNRHLQRGCRELHTGVFLVVIEANTNINPNCLGKVTVNHADFDVSVGKLIMHFILKKIPIPAETPCKFFYFIHNIKK